MNKDYYYPINSLKNKLKRIGIEVEFSANIPWIYLDKVNDVYVKECFYADHGFTAFWFPVRIDERIKFSDMKHVFKKIRHIVINGKE